jgi:hypothetical protein
VHPAVDALVDRKEDADAHVDKKIMKNLKCHIHCNLP